MTNTIQLEYIDKYGAKRKEIIEGADNLRVTQGHSYDRKSIIAVRPEAKNITIEGVRKLITPNPEQFKNSC
jgi:predicted PhzF superfamily epimerase YddE/YHI9